MKESGRIAQRPYYLFHWLFHLYVFRRKKYLPTLKNNYEKEKDEAYREKGLKRLNVNPDQISQKQDMNTTHLLSSFFPGREQWLKSKAIGQSKEGNIIVSVYCDLREKLK